MVSAFGQTSWYLVVALLLIHSHTARAKSKPVLSVPPSGSWDGRGGGGDWSSFFLELGSSAQDVRVLPVTSANAVWTAVPLGCIPSYGSECAKHRGNLFLTNTSTTWKLKGNYNIKMDTENGLGYYEVGEYGFDTVALGVRGNGLPTLTKQLVVGIAAPDVWLGAIPLSPWPVNFTTVNNSHDGLMTSLKKAQAIETLSWGYTAGTFARSPQVLGSLTLGGYDTSRFDPNNATYALSEDVSRDLVVPVKRIEISNNDVAMSETQYFFIDLLVPDLWLPDDVCDAFEKAFGITADNDTGLYLVSDSLHGKLSSQNLEVTFTLDGGRNVHTGNTNDETTKITMPYSAFDLQADIPLVQNTTRYFPLHRASSNSSQYTLGRAFLQAAYLIADYDRSNFSVHQALYPGADTQKDLVPILMDAGQAAHSGLSAGIIAGIVVGTVGVVAILVIVILLLRHKRRKSAARKSLTEKPPSKTADPYGLRSEMDASSSMSRAATISEDGKLNGVYVEAHGREMSKSQTQLDSSEIGELDGHDPKYWTNPVGLNEQVYEMDAGHPVAAEMEGHADLHVANMARQ